jgi:hypothetical protein
VRRIACYTVGGLSCRSDPRNATRHGLATASSSVTESTTQAKRRLGPARPATGWHLLRAGGWSCSIAHSSRQVSTLRSYCRSSTLTIFCLRRSKPACSRWSRGRSTITGTSWSRPSIRQRRTITSVGIRIRTLAFRKGSAARFERGCCRRAILRFCSCWLMCGWTI